MRLKIEPFQDSEAKLYTIHNKNGIELTVSDIGAVITSIIIPDKNGNKVDVALGYETFEGYKNNNSAYGAPVGRNANRIENASFILNGTTYQLDKNEGNNVLHGGFDKYFCRMWGAEVKDDENPSVTFKLISHDGDQGMPGAARISVTYSLSDDNEIIIRYYAIADKDTVFNITNHSYINLDGHNAGVVNNQYLWMDCNCFTPIDKEFIPTGEIREVKGTPMDFTVMKTIAEDIRSDYEQIKTGNGFDHNYVINNPGNGKPFAKALSSKTGIAMEVYTDLPGVQFYSGNNMGNDSGEKGSSKYVKHGAFCLETQYYPDAPNKPNFPSSIFKAGKPFDSTTIYKFSIEQ